MANEFDYKKIIGKIEKVDFEGLREFAKLPRKQVHDALFVGEDLPREFFNINSRFLNFCSWDRGDNPYPDFLKEIDRFEATFLRMKEFGKEVDVLYKSKTICVIQIGIWVDYLPTQFVTIKELIDYDNVTFGEAKKLLGVGDSVQIGSELQVMGEGVSKKDLQKKIDTAQLEIKEQEEIIREKQREIEEACRKQIESMKAEMSIKLQELELRKKELKRDVFKLDTELYSLRSLLGDNVTISKIRSGKRAPKDQPIVLFQKLRYLDEDLAKMDALYKHAWESSQSIEYLLKHDDRIMEQFCPNTKCVTLLKMSKDNKSYLPSSEHPNTLDMYLIENGNRIAILVRNGEELNIVWTEERIVILENFVVSQKGERQIEDNDEFHRTVSDPDMILSDDYTNRKDIGWRQYFSRVFLLQILQGLVDYQKMIEFPIKINFAFPSRYVIFSMADNALVDTSFGSLSDYIRKINVQSSAGDYILPIKTIKGSFTDKAIWGNGYYENHDRGRGERNRVRDCEIPDEVVKINLVDDIRYEHVLYDRSKRLVDVLTDEVRKELLEEQEEYIKAKTLLEASGKDRVSDGDIEYIWRYESAGRGYVWKENNLKRRRTGSITKLVHDRKRPKFYVSVDKPEDYGSNRSGKIAVRSNIQIYEDEFINLEYLSEEMLEYYINTKQVGNYFAGNYAYVIQYLHKALKTIREREEAELKMFEEELGCYHFDEDAKKYYGTIIANWKLKNGWHHWNKRTKRAALNYLMCEIGDYEATWQNVRSNLPWVEKEVTE